MKFKFKKGDSVKISPTGAYYNPNYPNNEDPSNPNEMEGCIQSVKTEENLIKVLWENGEANYYTQNDLEFFVDKDIITREYNKFKKIPQTKAVLPQDERVDIQKLSKCNTFQEAGFDYETVALLLSKYEVALTRAEEKLEYYDVLFKEGMQGFEKFGKIINPGKELIDREKELIDRKSKISKKKSPSKAEEKLEVYDFSHWNHGSMSHDPLHDSAVKQYVVKLAKEEEE